MQSSFIAALPHRHPPPLSLHITLACLLPSSPLHLAIASAPREQPHITFKAQRQKSQRLSPVILVPGAGGNQIEIKLTDQYEPSSCFCRRSCWDKGYFRAWQNLLGLVPPFTQCFVERMSLVYNLDSDQYENAPGVDSRVPHFGSTKGMVYLDPSFRELSVYMGVLVKALEAEGYVDGKSLLGAPYDFRYAPGQHATPKAATYLKDLRSLIERAYSSEGDQQVVLLSHSLGGLWVLHFLNQQTLSWRQKYIKHFIAVSVPWGGSVQEMWTYASGYAEGVPLTDPLVLREAQRSSESNLWLLPVPLVFENRTLVITPTKNYSASDIPEFLEDIGYSEGVPLYQSRVPSLTNNLEAPGIPVTLIFSSGIDTAETLVYGRKGFDEQPRVVNGDGDGTVNLCSLSAVTEKWSATAGQTMKVIKIKGKTHSAILTDLGSVEVMVSEIMGGAPTKSLLQHS